MKLTYLKKPRTLFSFLFIIALFSAGFFLTLSTSGIPQAADTNNTEKNNTEHSIIIVDIDGDGFQTSSLAESKVYFDVDRDGLAERTSWVSPSDGILALLLSREDGQQTGHINFFTSLLIDGENKIIEADRNNDGIYDERDFIQNRQKLIRPLSVSIIKDQHSSAIPDGIKSEKCKVVILDMSENTLHCNGKGYKFRIVSLDYEDTNVRWNAMCDKSSVKMSENKSDITACMNN